MFSGSLRLKRTLRTAGVLLLPDNTFPDTLHRFGASSALLV